jgi:hypothetical protein
MVMTKYDEDLEYAKKILNLLNKIKDKKIVHEQLFTRTLNYGIPRTIEFAYIVSTHNTVVSMSIGNSQENSTEDEDYESVCNQSSLIFEYTDTKIWICNTDEPDMDPLILDIFDDYSEEVYFQNSLIYSDFVNRMLLIHSYLMNPTNRIKGIGIFEISWSKMDDVLKIIDELEDQK